MLELVRASLANGRLCLDSQPIVRLSTGEVAADELLVRLVTDDGHVVPPSKFVPIAEQHGLMPRIDRFVIERGVALAAAGRFVHVNLSATTVSDRALFGDILTTIQEHRAEPARITFEITETAAAANMEDAANLADKLRAFGFRIALDDFGSGWGTFRYLSALPIDLIKIEREFITDVASSEKAADLIRGVVGLAGMLGIETVAEGVEDARTLAALRDLHVDYAQGFHMGRHAAETTTRRRGARALRLVS